jgi:hypothetical protein
LTQRSKQRAASAALLVCALLAIASSPAAAPPRPYHIELIANPAAPFPFLSKFGTMTLHIYPAGVRADTLWLNGFSRNGAPTVTVENPYARMYTVVPMSEITNVMRKMAKDDSQSPARPSIAPPVSGRVNGIAARRYRLMYGPEAWIDVWTTSVIPENPQLRRIVTAFVRGVSPPTAESIQSIPGTPIYVELNFHHYKKLPLVRLKRFSSSNVGQENALNIGTLYFKAPLLDQIWK